MSVESLPLKIRADIRDHWDSPKAPIQASVEDLAKTLGHRLVPRVEWPLLYNSLKDRFSDKSTFVPTISQIVNTFYLKLISKLEDEANSEWTEEFLGVLAKSTPGSTYPLRIEASTNAGPRPRVSWKAELKSFYLEVPNSEPALRAILEAGFDQDLDNLLSGSDSLNDDEWAEVTELETRSTRHTPQGIPRAIVERLPKMDMLARPVDLFKTTTPSILIVDAHAQPLTIQCSHQPSLDLLASYLKKWGKTNPDDGLKRHYLKITLIESLFSEGLIDAITIEPYSSYRMDKETPNPTLVLAFIEGTLGYKLVHTTGVRWVYKSENIFK
ncbi:hypothetical protein BYT27DRAFT_7205618 [Phlegmacium glaucopus]|nr:hypothetical protein BYT27DRAFT_7205618 [Phlegmacium glaucopus]